jgi:hypothetical protein
MPRSRKRATKRVLRMGLQRGRKLRLRKFHHLTCSAFGNSISCLTQRLAVFKFYTFGIKRGS